MPVVDWYPSRLADLPPWHANFNTEAAASGTTLGLTALETTQIGIDAGIVLDVINYAEAIDAFRQEVTAFKNSVLEGDALAPMPALPIAPADLAAVLGSLPGIEDRTRGFVATIKGSAAYTTAIGEAYGVVAPASGGPGTPEVIATALTASQVKLRIIKSGYDVLAVDSRRGGGGWEQIGISMTAEYIDTRAPLSPGDPEQREFRVQGMDDNARVGLMSDVSTAVTVP